jgi:hypothetical protein
MYKNQRIYMHQVVAEIYLKLQIDTKLGTEIILTLILILSGISE